MTLSVAISEVQCIIERVRVNRDTAPGSLLQLARSCFAVYPVRRLRADELLYERRDGRFVLDITDHPEFSIPRVAAFERVLGATIFSRTRHTDPESLSIQLHARGTDLVQVEELSTVLCGFDDGYYSNGGRSMNKITPFLWFNDNAEEAANFYLSIFPAAKKMGELRSSGVGPWPAGQIATITIELMGQQMTFLNGGPAQALTPAFSYSVACKDQPEIDRYWDKLIEGGKPMACGWLTDKFGLCWQIVPEKIGEILKHPKAMAAMMEMVKFDIATLEAAANE